jgi:hypothetical protein
MSFPIEFSKPRGDYDFISSSINLAGNAMVVAVGGISVGAISALALQALGVKGTATAIVTALPFVVGTVSAITAIAAIASVVAIALAIGKGFSHR